MITRARHTDRRRLRNKLFFSNPTRYIILLLLRLPVMKNRPLVYCRRRSMNIDGRYNIYTPGRRIPYSYSYTMQHININITYTYKLYVLCMNVFLRFRIHRSGMYVFIFMGLERIHQRSKVLRANEITRIR